MKKIVYAVLFLLFAAVLWLGLQGAPDTDGISNEESGRSMRVLKVNETDPYLGKRDAPVTVIVMSSFGCPACKSAAAIMDQLVALYPDAVRIVRKDLPETAGDSYRAALAARCAQQQGMFWQYHDLLFAKQEVTATEQLYVLWARELGLDADIFQRCMDAQDTAHLVDRNIAESLGLDIMVVPYYQVQDKEGFAGPQTLAFFRREIDALLQRSE